MTTPDALIIGGGPAGLATAAALAEKGLRGLVLEKADVAESWRHHYARLHLHTPREFSHLPGLKIPRRFGRWVSRDDLVRYLELYRDYHDLDVRTGTEVVALEHEDGTWVATTLDGERLRAPHVVVATGYNHTPVPPDFPGLETFTGEVVPSSTYLDGAAYAGKDVLVVGTGNTGCEIAVDLIEHGAASVHLSVRTPPHILRRSIGPWPTQLSGILVRYLPSRLIDPLAAKVTQWSVPDLTAHGLPRPEAGLLSRINADHAIPVQDVGIVDAIRGGSVTPVAALVGFADDDVLLADGTRLQPDAVVVATGYKQGLDGLVGPFGVLAATGRPTPDASRRAPGLHFIGYTNPISGMLREIRIESRRIAARIARTQASRQVPKAPARAT